MHRLLRDAALRQELIARGYARARLFSWEETARQTLAVYQEALAD
jgi:glycosyltransferase involved in cell wall biosynthesis